MDAKAAEIKNMMTLNLLVQILKERGIMTDKELIGMIQTKTTASML